MEIDDRREPDPPNTRRVRLLTLDCRSLMRLFEHDPEYPIQVVEGIPKGSHVVNVSYAFDRNAIVVVIEHESFEPVQVGHIIPEMFPLQFRREKIPCL